MLDVKSIEHAEGTEHILSVATEVRTASIKHGGLAAHDAHMLQWLRALDIRSLLLDLFEYYAPMIDKITGGFSVY